jgi:signal transduction histidine kinase/FixJ family two-component response regulator
MTDKAANIMVVDDEVRMCESLHKLLSAEGYAVETFVDSTQALAALQAPRGFDCIITDIKMPGPDGMQILKQAQESDPLAPVILMTGYASLESAVEAVNAGAYDYLLKPIEFPELKQTVERGLAKRWSDQNRRELLERLERQNRMLRERLKELRTLHRVGRSISSARPLEDVLQDLLRGATQVTNAEQGSLMLLDPERSELSIHAAIGLPEEVIRGTRLKIGEGISGYVAQTREVVRVENVAADPRFARTPHPRYESKSFLSVPLLISDRILGVLNVSSKTGGEPFRPRDLRVLTIFAAQAAAFIDDARNFENHRRQLEEQRVLYNIAREVATAERFEDVAQAIYSSLKEILPLDFGLWLGWNEVRNILHYRSAAGEKAGEEQWADFELPLPQDTWQNEARFCELVRLAVKGHAAWPPTLHVLQVMAIHGEERPRGALVLGSYRGEKLTPQQLQIATIAGSQAATVYERQQGALNTTRMTTMGNMISEIAHDLKKPLTNIKGSLQLLEQKHPELAEMDPFFQSADQEIHHLNDLVRELVEFSNPVRYPLDRVALRVPVARALGLIRSEAARRNVTVEESYAPHPINVRGQENEIVKAMLNVLHNAVDSMNDGGALSVRTFVAQPENESENYAAVEVKDTGHGIKPEEQHKIFARHFTTKSTGSGLGLAIVERILQAHNGLIAVKSELGVGTAFTLYFPLAN